jgi:hypothetical protein
MRVRGVVRGMNDEALTWWTAVPENEKRAHNSGQE